MKKSKNSVFRFALAFFSSTILLLSPFGSANAAIDSCQVNVTPTSVQPNSQTLYSFSITNHGPSDITWLQIQRPSTNFTISSTAWAGSTSIGDAQATLYEGSQIGPGETSAIGLSVHAGEAQSSGDFWTVIASENFDGSDSTVCAGTLGATVTGARVSDPDTTPPAIEQIRLSKLKTNSIVMSWTTDEPANSDVAYGETGDFGQNAHDAAFVTEHSITVNDLSGDTSYHYLISSYDSSGNGTSAPEGTFLTPDADSTSTQEVGISLKTVIPLKAVPTEKIPPTITLKTDISKPQKSTPTLTGTAEDNEALAGIFYSTDSGKNWLPVESVIGLGTKKASFSFTPQNLQDGNYGLRISAIDTSSNQAETAEQILVIDRLPPIVGGNVITIGSQSLPPDSENTISSLVGIDQKITLSAVGGPTTVTIIATEVGKDKIVQSFSLTKSPDSGLWSGVLSFSKAGTFQLSAASIDGAENKTLRKLNIVKIGEAGKVVNTENKKVKARIRVYSLENETNTWSLWDGEEYDQNNPTFGSVKGGYSLYLPAGTYYLKVDASGYQTVITHSFTLTKPGVVNRSFRLKSKLGLDLGPVHIRLPWLVFNDKDLASSSNDNEAPKASIIDTAMPQVNLKMTNGKNLATAELYGKPTILTFVNTWSSSVGEQLESLSSITEPSLNIFAVSSGESIPKLTSYAKIAGFDLPIIADVDNELIEKLKGGTIPVTYFLDRHGVVKKVITGILTKNELLANVVL